MRLKKEIIDKVNTIASRRTISTKLNCGDQMLYIHLNENKENGRLTKLDALKAIGEEVGISNVMEMVEDVEESVSA